ncbi:hypothetical protein ACIRSF_00775 [Streptomyces rubiginosohelvolus]|uniref:hypothetical protein n=1 Tax=Streptomyces TaxID=1883 RepID=UPI000BF16FFA|nr:hypothetical protein [Streptomyces sp. gb14]
MRLRSALAAALGAGVLLITTPAPASAVAGQLRYDYMTAEGFEASGFLSSPPSGQCLNLPGAGEDNPQPARSPKNRTDAWATVFTGTDCEGDSFPLRPHTGGASKRLKVRSVVFN